jgi:hypothetical protein
LCSSMRKYSEDIILLTADVTRLDL